MLYVFQVDTGIMMTFEMKLAMETVRNLKKAIATKTQLHEDKQVLLISGGESLNSSQRVCSYSSAGTDTSPIFLFAKFNIESNQPPLPTVDYGSDTDMTEMIESCITMAPSLDTLVARTELAADLQSQAASQREVCEHLVHDQHLQQQGWAAVTANLEDLIRAFHNKAEILMVAFKEFVKQKPAREELLGKFKNDQQLINNMPVLPALMENNRFNSSSLQSSNNSNEIITAQLSSETTTKVASDQPLVPADSVPATSTAAETSPTVTSSPVVTLLQWIDFHDNKNNLDKLAEACWLGLERFTEASAEQIRIEVQDVLKSANNSNMKEIKGLEERLFGLEKLMVDAKKVVDEQNQLALSFQNNKDRYSKIKDLSLLPDLSASHKHQLQMMLVNHKKMNDFRNRCIKAKHELSVNLHNRLKWIMYIEQQISDLDGKLMVYKENLSRLNRNFEIIDQVHRAPNLYLAAVTEAMRRRRFSRSYLHWASSIAKKSQELYEKEMKLRKEFDQTMGTHFLANLFPGLTRSYPPPFATIPPDPFDTKLPRITAADIHYLQSNICDELADKLTIPKEVPMPHIITISQKVIDNIVDSSQPEEVCEDLDDRQSLNPTPPSSPQLNTAAKDY